MTRGIERVLTVDQDVVDDPYPIWAELRANCPVYREPEHGVVVVTRYDDIVDVARRPTEFSSVMAAYGPNGADRGPTPERLCAIARAGADHPGQVREVLDAYRPDVQDQLQHVDPPLHTVHRRIVSRWFTPPAVAAREPAVRAIATRLLDQIDATTRVEMLDGFAGPFPATVVADTIGIPLEHRETFLDWKEEIIGNPEAEVSRVTSERYRTIRALFVQLIHERRADPRDDVISALSVQPQLDDAAVVGLLMLFLGGGQETTAKALTTGMRILGDRPSLQESLREHPSLLPGFIEEVLRFDNPVRGIFRQAVNDTTVGGVDVPEGSFLQLMWASGNRDESVFDDADSFVPGRNLARQILSFGHGVHLCPGAPLARLQLRVGFEELLARFRFTLCADNPFTYFRSQVLRGLAGLWVDLEPVGP
jgi:cytochrome P450 family 150 subfamily A5